MFLRTEGKSLLALIGDPHMGRQFTTNVAPERRGEREAIQYQKLKDLLNNLHVDTGEKARTCICMGDLFDQFEVDASMIFTVYWLLADAAYANPDVDYVVLQGNHDVTRNTELKSSFDLLQHMLANIENILFVTQVEYLITRDANETLMFFPYDAFTSASDLVKNEIALGTGQVAAVFGHWDIEQFSENIHNLVPTEELKKITKLIVTGHVHGHKIVDLGDDVTLLVTGSMMPFSHGEDHDSIYYVTVTLKEYYDAIEKDPRVYHDKSLRILLATGEEPPTHVDAFQHSWKKLDSKSDASDLEVKMEVFSFRALFDECMAANKVDKDTSQFYWDRYEGISNDHTS